MSHYKAIFDTLTPKQRDVMGQLALDNGAALKDKPTVRKLIQLGLIETWNEPVTLAGRIPVTINSPKYGMPVAVHIAWCEWCSEQPEIVAEAEL